MTSKNLLATGIKLLGLYYLIWFIPQQLSYAIGTYGALAFMDTPELPSGFQNIHLLNLINALTAPIVGLIICYLFIFRTEVLVNRVSRNHEESSNPEYSISKLEIIEVVIIALSIFLIVNIIPEILGPQIQRIYFWETLNDRLWTQTMKVDLVKNLLVVFVSVFLIFNAKRLSKWISKENQSE